MDSHEISDDRSGFWTNEKHVNFLNMMEASFVRTMLVNEGRSMLTYATGYHAPLDRYLPDSSESTRNLKNRRNIRKTTSHVYFPEVTDLKIIRNDERRRRRRRSRRPYDFSQDQVVPQIGSIKVDKDDVEESGKPLSHFSLPNCNCDGDSQL